jgi:Cof subfamily protein (haloacid dehalogenase superfamily)
MKKFENILICTDLDGTLLNSQKQISRENLEAIEYFKSEGGYFTFVTGRPPVIAFNICDMVSPNAPFGCFNGGGLYDHVVGKYLWYEEMSHSICEMLDDVRAEFCDIGFQLNTAGPIYFCNDSPTMENFRRITGAPKLIKDYRDIEEPFVKVVFGDSDPEKIKRLAAYLAAHPMADQFEFVSAESTLYEILVKGTHKGAVISRLCEILGVDRRRTVAIGDYDNDVGMLREAGVGVAVSNASPAAMAAADVMLGVSNNEHAIAKLIHDIEIGKIDLTI